MAAKPDQAHPVPLTPELARRMPRLLEAMTAIGGDVELRTLLRRIVRTAAELAGARYAALAVLNDDGDAIEQFVTFGGASGAGEAGETAAAGETREGGAAAPLPGSEGLIRSLLEHGRPMLLDDLTLDPRSVGFPPGLPPARSLLGVPLRVHEAGFGALYLADKRGEGPFTDDDAQVLRVLATEAGIAIGNARLYEAFRQQARWMDGSLELSTSLLSEDPDNALAVVAEQARRLADASAAVVLVPTGTADGLEVVAAHRLSGMLGTVLPAVGEVARQLLTGEPVFSDDASADPRLTSGFARRFGPLMLLPLARDGRTLGILALPRVRGGLPYTVPQRALATQFAQQAALALVLAEAQRDREQLAVYEDRDRIARDLHDLVIQRLFAVGMILEGAQRTTPSPEAQERIGMAARELDATIQEIRTAIFALQQPPDEAPSGLRTRVLRETGAAAQSLGFQPGAAFTGPVDSRVGEGVTRNLIAALREALSNAARHAGASRVEVAVDATTRLPDGQDAVRLTVTDDGIGLPEEDRRRSGLRNLIRRAEGLGGAADIGPGPEGRGTRLTWQVPL